MTGLRNDERHGEKNPVARMSNKDARQMREYRAGGFSLADLARLYGVSESTASYCIHGKTYLEAGGPIEPVRSRKFTESVIPRAG